MGLIDRKTAEAVIDKLMRGIRPQDEGKKWLWRAAEVERVIRDCVYAPPVEPEANPYSDDEPRTTTEVAEKAFSAFGKDMDKEVLDALEGSKNPPPQMPWMDRVVHPALSAAKKAAPDLYEKEMAEHVTMKQLVDLDKIRSEQHQELFKKVAKLENSDWFQRMEKRIEATEFKLDGLVRMLSGYQ